MDSEALLAKLKQYPIAVGGVVLAIVFGLLIYFRGGKIPELEAKQEDLDLRWKTIQTNAKQAVDINEDVSRMTQFAGEIDERLIDRDARAINYQYFYRLEESSGVSLTTLNQSASVPAISVPLSLTAPVEYAVAAAGTYPQILNFLYSLEHGRIFSRIETFSCTAASDEEANNVKINLKMSILGTK